MRTFKIYSFGNFQSWNTVLLTVHSTRQDLLTTGSLYLLTTFTYFTLTLPSLPADTNLMSVSMSSIFFSLFQDSAHEWSHTVSFSVCFILFEGKISFFHDWIIFQCVCVCVCVCVSPHTYILFIHSSSYRRFVYMPSLWFIMFNKHRGIDIFLR